MPRGSTAGGRTRRPGESSAPGTSVSRSLEAIRMMILSGELLPGEQIRQVQLAERLGISRIPVREALTTLQGEGVVDYTPHAGYTVARFNSKDLTEIYLMRRLLEAELLRTADLSRVDVDELVDLNGRLAEVRAEEIMPERKDINRRFHFSLFEASPLDLVRAEVSRLWNMSEFYRSLYAYEEDTHRRIVAEHDRIIAAVRARDSEELVAACDDHRGAAENLLVRRLGPPRSRRA